MSKEEDKLDKFLRDIITDSGFETPPSDDYTRRVMLEAAVIQDSQTRKARFSNQLAIGSIGIVMWAFFGIAVYFLWQMEWIGNVMVFISNLLEPVFDIFSMTTIRIIIIGSILHTIISRSLLAMYFMKKESQMELQRKMDR